MSHHESNSAFTAFLVGGLIGVVAGLLIAPKAGRETREDIEEWLDETVNKTKDQARMANEKLHAAKAKVEGRIKTYAHKIEEEFSGVKPQQPQEPMPQANDNPFVTEENN